jgi:iron complex transport system ATP-binding protein
MLVAENIVVGYQKNEIVFPAVNFSAKAGDMIALLGVNGIGKSTLLRTIAGLQKQLAGEIIFDGIKVHSISAQERSRLISVVLTERIFIDNITVKDFILLGRAPYTNWLGTMSEADRAAVEEVIKRVGIEKLRKRQFNQLSDGEKQKVLIARALCQQTPLMILDEPTAFLDFRNKKEVLELLAGIRDELKKIILLSTHDIETALSYCNKCWIMTEDKQFCEIQKGDNYRQQVMDKLFAAPLNG